MNEELEVLKIVTGRLAQAGIPYMITGSVAGNFYAMPRMTRDIDIVIDLAEPDVRRIVEMFRDDFYVDGAAVQQAARERGMFNIIHSAHVVKVDFVVRKDSEYRREEFSRRRPIRVEGTEMFLVAPEDLILSKLEWAKDTRSEIQLADVRNLLEAVEGLDRHYLLEWAKKLSVEALYRDMGG